MNIKRLNFKRSVSDCLNHYVEVKPPHNFYCGLNGYYKKGSYAWVVCENRVFIDIKLPQYFDDIYLELSYKHLSFKEILAYKILLKSSTDDKAIAEINRLLYNSQRSVMRYHNYNGFVHKRNKIINKLIKRFENEFSI